MASVRGIEVHNGYAEVPLSEGSLILGRVSTLTKAGADIVIGATAVYQDLIFWRASVQSWAGIGSVFRLLYIRAEAAIDATGKTLYAMEVYAANKDDIDIATLQAFIFNVMGKGNSTITLMRGGEIKLEWLATDVITNARALQIEYMGLAAPTNPVYGIYFEKESAAGAMAAKFYEIRLKAGPCIISGSGAPSMAAPKGSLYIRTDGTTTNDRAYINSDGSTTWTALTTAA